MYVHKFWLGDHCSFLNWTGPDERKKADVNADMVWSLRYFCCHLLQALNSTYRLAAGAQGVCARWDLSSPSWEHRGGCDGYCRPLFSHLVAMQGCWTGMLQKHADMQFPLSLTKPGCCSANRVFTVTGPNLYRGEMCKAQSRKQICMCRWVGGGSISLLH